MWQWAKQGSSRQYPLLLYMFCFHLLYISMYVRTYETFQHWRIQTRDCPKFSIGYFCFLPQNRRPRPRLAWSGCADICKMQIQHQQLIARILQGDMLHSSWSIMSPRFQRIIQIFKAYVYQHRHIQIIDSDTISESNRIRQLNLVLLTSGSNIYPEIPCTDSYSIRSGLKSIEFDVFTFRKCWNPLHQINSTILYTLQKPKNLRVVLCFWSVTGITIIYLNIFCQPPGMSLVIMRPPSSSCSTKPISWKAIESLDHWGRGVGWDYDPSLNIPAMNLAEDGSYFMGDLYLSQFTTMISDIVNGFLDVMICHVDDVLKWLVIQPWSIHATKTNLCPEKAVEYCERMPPV